MADDNIDNSPVDETDKSVVVVKQQITSGSVSVTAVTNSRKDNEGDSSLSEATSSISTSASASTPNSNQASPSKQKQAHTGSGPGSSSGNSKERRHKEGYHNRRSSSGKGDKKNSASTSSAASPVVGRTDTNSSGIEGSANTGTTPNTSQGSKTKNKRFSVKKRPPPKEEIEVKPNDVFVNEKSNFPAQIGKCKRIFEKGEHELFLHGLGKAIPRAINLAFELRKFYHGTVDYTVNTSTIELIDDLIDLEDPEQPATVRSRKVSSVNIRVYRCIDIP